MAKGVRYAIHLLFSVLFPLFLGGCASVQEYPEQWGEGFPEHDFVFEKYGQNCDLSGTYINFGESGQGQKGNIPVSLFNLLFPAVTLSAEIAPNRVTLDGPKGGELKIIAWNDAKPLDTRLLKSFACFESGLVMVNPGAAKSHADLAVTFAAGNQDNFLYRTSDGWLILKRVDLTAVIPWFKFETGWYRFRPLSSSQ